MASICFSDEKNESPQRFKDPDKELRGQTLWIWSHPGPPGFKHCTFNHYTVTLNINLSKFLIKICEFNKRLTKTK